MTSPAAPVSLPLLVTPGDAESLSSWLARLAMRYRASVRVVARTVHVENAAHWENAARLDILGLPEPLANHIAAAASLPATEMGDLMAGLSGYDAFVRTACSPRHRPRLRPLMHARFCPACLDEHGGQWSRWWRLPWFLACPEHQVYLVDACPQCAGPQRGRGASRRHLPDGRFCDSWHSARVRRAGPCAGDLRRAATEPADQGVLSTQGEMLRLLLAGSHGDLAGRLANLVAVETAIAVDSGRRSRARSAAGGLLAEAMSTLNSRERLHQFALADVSLRPSPTPRRMTDATPSLEAEIAAIRDPYCRIADRLRWRSCDRPRRPQDASPEARLRTERMPSILWRATAAAVLPPRSSISLHTFQIAAAEAITIVGVTADESSTFSRSAHHVFRTLKDEGTETAAITSLIHIADTLDAGGSPIDYGRRRRLWGRGDAMSRTEWLAILDGAGLVAGGTPQHRQACVWLRETLTGDAPVSTAAERRAYAQFSLGLTPDAAAELLAHAHGLLRAAGIDEPLEWSPTVAPAVDIGAERLTEAQELLRRGWTVLSVAVRQGCSPDMLFAALRDQPPGLAISRRASPRGKWARTAIPDAEAIARRMDAGESLRDIAAATGVSRQVLTDTLIKGGQAPPKVGRRPRARPSPAELAAAYEVETMRQIAARWHVTPPTVGRWLDDAGIKRRRPGACSHLAALAPAPGTSLLERALRGSSGPQRVRRFVEVASHDDLQEAAYSLGVHRTRLEMQIARLERSVGERLITIDGGHIALTDAGLLLLAQTRA